jgi:hypothetical protein
MTRCKYLPVNSESSDINTFGREGEFITLGTQDGETMAYVMDKTGRIEVTYGEGIIGDAGEGK